MQIAALFFVFGNQKITGRLVPTMRQVMALLCR